MDNDENKISDFSAVGLDKFMRPIGAPASNQGSFVSGMDFNTYFDRNAVSSINLKNFSFNAGTGGTLVLGGTNNGNGNFVIRNAAGSTIVTGNNQGLAVTGGNISVKNANNTTILDTAGIVSTANFPNDQIISNSTFTTTSTTYQDVPGATFTLIATRDINILFNYLLMGVNSDGYATHGYGVKNQLYDSFLGTYAISGPVIFGYDGIFAISNPSPGVINWNERSDASPMEISTLLRVQAGTHIYTLQYAAYVGGTAIVTSYIVNYVELGA